MDYDIHRAPPGVSSAAIGCWSREKIKFRSFIVFLIGLQIDSPSLFFFFFCINWARSVLVIWRKLFFPTNHIRFEIVSPIIAI